MKRGRGSEPTNSMMVKTTVGAKVEIWIWKGGPEMSGPQLKAHWCLIVWCRINQESLYGASSCAGFLGHLPKSKWGQKLPFPSRILESGLQWRLGVQAACVPARQGRASSHLYLETVLAGLLSKSSLFVWCCHLPSLSLDLWHGAVAMNSYQRVGIF